jgi:hypothetical protein
MRSVQADEGERLAPGALTGLCIIVAAKKGSLCTSGLVSHELSCSVLYGVNANSNVEGDGGTKGRGTW